MVSAGKSEAQSWSVNLIMAVWLSLSLVLPADAFFRHLCNKELGFARIDPIMAAGKASQHLHALHGSSNLGPDATEANFLLEGNCTSCSITLDKSGYWAPAMYFQHENKNLELLNTSGGITVYYKFEKRVNFEDQNYTVFPNGFRMIAGDSQKRNWVGPWPVPAQSLWGPNDTAQDALATKALGFNCLNYITGQEEPSFGTPWLRNKTFIDGACPDGIRSEILFPSCWDGVNLDSPNHKDHVAYPTLLQDGACPRTHPVYLPIIFYETIWNTPYFKDLPGQFVLSNGDPTGYGYHGDFIAAWEDGVLERIVQDPTCTDHDLSHRVTSGLQEECQVIAPSLQSKEEAAQCRLQTPEILEHEKVTGPLTTLPGNMPITGKRHDPGTDAEDSQPQNNPPADSSVMSSATPIDISSTVSTAVSTSNSHTVVETSSTILPSSSTSATMTSSKAVPTVPATLSSEPSSSGSSSSLAATMSSSASSVAMTPAPTTLSPAVASIASTSVYTSGSMVMEVDLIEEVITLVTTVTPTATTSIIGRHHVHGGRRHANTA